MCFSDLLYAIPKTDRIDSMIIAQYGIDFWYRVKQQNDRVQERQELRLL